MTKLGWKDTPSAELVVNPAKIDKHQHSHMNCLELIITDALSSAYAYFKFKVSIKTGTAHLGLPYRPTTRGMLFEVGSRPRSIDC